MQNLYIKEMCVRAAHQTPCTMTKIYTPKSFAEAMLAFKASVEFCHPNHSMVWHKQAKELALRFSCLHVYQPSMHMILALIQRAPHHHFLLTTQSLLSSAMTNQIEPTLCQLAKDLHMIGMSIGGWSSYFWPQCRCVALNVLLSFPPLPYQTANGTIYDWFLQKLFLGVPSFSYLQYLMYCDCGVFPHAFCTRCSAFPQDVSFGGYDSWTTPLSSGWNCLDLLYPY